MIEIEWDSQEDRARRHHRPKASTVHGWVTKMRGTLLGSESIRRRGIREMKEARAIRKYKRNRADHQSEARDNGRSPRRSGGLFSVFSFSRRRHSHDVPVVVHRDRPRHREKGKAPLLHSPYRTKPHHHGHGTRLRGQLTRKEELVLQGKSMNEAAQKERRRERRRRDRRRKREALAIRADGALNGNRTWRIP
ncbi:hypothetical protein A0H81_03744 [Grifola frondosa]|uniref:Uncharacterized protein n=1 Tax=Grifola frondosa TaxID=5627 RepID=A0A1C7MI02_GRIFR|nr:hypothetical protein A0H81_03744 [Grifola frondosa]